MLNMGHIPYERCLCQESHYNITNPVANHLFHVPFPNSGTTLAQSIMSLFSKPHTSGWTCSKCLKVESLTTKTQMSDAKKGLIVSLNRIQRDSNGKPGTWSMYIVQPRFHSCLFTFYKKMTFFISVRHSTA